MSLALDKNLWDWASQIASDHDEHFARICASLLSDAIDGKLSTSPPLAEESRQFLRNIDAVGKFRAGGRSRWLSDDPHYPGYWLTRLIVGEIEMHRWLTLRQQPGRQAGGPGTTKQPAHRLSRKDAVPRVGNAIFGNHWIGQLNNRERWLLDRYVDGEVPPMPRQSSSTILPGKIVCIDTSTGRPWLEPSLRAEVDLAADRREWCRAQYQRVDEWFKENGFGGRSGYLDAGGFERALIECFGAVTSADRAGPKKRKTRRDEKRWEIAEAVVVLRNSDEWQGLKDKERCRLVDNHLGKQAGWCRPRTLGRAVAVLAKQRTARGAALRHLRHFQRGISAHVISCNTS